MTAASWIDELNRRLALEPIVCRCAFCAFTVETTLEEAREAFEAHECSRPQPTELDAGVG